ncbi:helix-turn-helix domain-containing protein [Lacrimispora defluvii]|uniref:Helix-turn-helix transcriptional regulator n=1 Tax=Lacrimispora defluvii TaxID=2719233 RepID=A0ABX1VWB8_9FIRM|nr:helix-turn-helix transcriptional regulator [Lacrimispora defluvii]NNJ32712.1 helix-turn-helix transcriptional regulator [Lacrimispora defluvii]
MDQRQIGKFIAELRNEKGMTQSELGERIGVTNKTVSRWENGNYMPDISVITMLCVELGVSANELLCAQRLNDSEFKIKADENLMETLSHMKNIKHEKSIIDFFTGAGTGIVVSCLFSPISIRRTFALLVGIILIGIGWYRKAKYDKMILQLLGERNKEC